MGCRTGFYLLVRDTVSHEQALQLVIDSFAFIAQFEGEIPGASEVECGNYREQDLEGAKAEARAMLPVLEGWSVEKMQYQS